MNILHSSSCERGASAWTVVGGLMVIAGMAGLGIALIKPGNKTASVAPVATGGGAAPALARNTKPAAPVAAASAVTRTDPPGSGPHPNWHGTWRGATPEARMVITATKVGDCQWINATEPRLASDCESGYAKSSVSLADISRRYEEAVAVFQRDPSDFSISDPAESRRSIGRIKPGNYRVIWMQDGSDCGMGDLIIDGDLILRVVNCKYRNQISLFTREAVAPPAVAREVQGPAGKTATNRNSVPTRP